MARRPARHVYMMEAIRTQASSNVFAPIVNNFRGFKASRRARKFPKKEPSRNSHSRRLFLSGSVTPDYFFFTG
jgi:hypothetical protein